MKIIEIEIRDRKIRGEITDADSIFFLSTFLFNEPEMVLYRDGCVEEALDSWNKRLNRTDAISDDDRQKLEKQLAGQIYSRIEMSRRSRAMAAWRLVTQCFPGQLKGLIDFVPGESESFDEGVIRLDVEEFWQLFGSIVSAIVSEAGDREAAQRDRAVKQESSSPDIPESEVSAIALPKPKEEINEESIKVEEGKINLDTEDGEEVTKDPIPAIAPSAPSPKVIDFDNLTEEEKSELAQKYEELKLQKSKP